MPRPARTETVITTLLLSQREVTDVAAESWGAQPDSQPARQPPHGRPCILVAEDDSMVMSFLVRLLSDAGYEVRAARHGAEALRLAQQGPVDLLVTDVRMPVMDGWELCRRLRERWPDLPAVFISGFDVELTGTLSRRPAGAFLRKPFDPDELVRQVALLLEA